MEDEGVGYDNLVERGENIRWQCVRLSMQQGDGRGVLVSER